MKIWCELPQWLPRTNLTNFQIMAQRCRVGCSVKHQQHAKLCQTSHNNKCNTGAVSSWATSCSSGCFMSNPDSQITVEQIVWFLNKFTSVFRFFRSCISSIVWLAVLQLSFQLFAHPVYSHSLICACCDGIRFIVILDVTVTLVLGAT